MWKAEVVTRDEVGACPVCHDPLTVPAVYVDDRRLPIVDPMCDRCVEKDVALAQSCASVVTPTPGAHTELDWLSELGVNTRKHGTATLESFDATDAPLALRAAWGFVEDVSMSGRHDQVRGLYLAGPTGCGKSHLGVAIIRASREERPDLNVIYEPADRLVMRVQDTYGSGTTDAVIEARKRADLYVLDDLGREKPTPDALRVLATILDEREGTPTVITSNQLPHELGARHGESIEWGRIASRLGDTVYRYVRVNGRDRRFQDPA